MSLCTEKTSTIFTDKYDLPQWPDQETLTLKHKNILDCLFSTQKTLISEYSFSGFFLFTDVYAYQVSKLHSAVIITGTDGHRPFVVLPCSCPSKEILLQLQQQDHYIKALSYRGKEEIQKLLGNTDNYTIISDEGDFDYMYKRSNLQTLSGRKFHKKRNLINHFMHEYTQHTTVKITAERLNDVWYLLQKWNVTHHTDADSDYLACKKAIIHYKELDFLGQITYVKGVPVGFVIGELRNNNICAVIHFEKGDVDYVGIYQYINQKFVSSLPEECKVINREQDLGKEGLRQAKRTYRPNALLKKYRVYFHGSSRRD